MEGSLARSADPTYPRTMASSPSPANVRPSAPFRASATPTTLLADIFSYGYAVVVMWATLVFDLQFAMWQGITLMVVFVALRGIARELRKDARRLQLQDARRVAALRAQSPSRWSVEQRDGLGRRVDTGA